MANKGILHNFDKSKKRWGSNLKAFGKATGKVKLNKKFGCWFQLIGYSIIIILILIAYIKSR